jgi:hypothetical protein
MGRGILRLHRPPPASKGPQRVSSGTGRGGLNRRNAGKGCRPRADADNPVQTSGTQNSLEKVLVVQHQSGAVDD